MGFVVGVTERGRVMWSRRQVVDGRGCKLQGCEVGDGSKRVSPGFIIKWELDLVRFGPKD